jgi:hypothetical protein
MAGGCATQENLPAVLVLWLSYAHHLELVKQIQLNQRD